MKIVALTAENVKKLTVVEIRPDGNLVQITGRNGQGKTSVLDAIWWALEGAKHIQTAPIRKGEKEARIRLDLGDLVVTRSFKDKDGEITTSIVVENADGARFPSPQRMLDALLGELTFDPLAFTRMDQRAQFDLLRGFVPDVDFDGIDKANAADFQERRDLNRRARELRAQEAGIELTDTPASRIDDAVLVAELERAGEVNADLEKRRARRDAAAEKIGSLRETAEQHRQRAITLRRQADEAETAHQANLTEAAELERRLATADALPEPIDTAAIRHKIAEARDRNALAERQERARAERTRLGTEASDAEARAAKLTERMEARTAEKEAAVRSAKLPVDGLGFGDGVVILNGVPFDQASDAEQLRVSIAIAMAMNPRLRVIRVRDGSLLDEDALALIGQMADQHDYQVWVERVDSSGKVGFVLEDGHLKAVPAAEEAA